MASMSDKPQTQDDKGRDQWPVTAHFTCNECGRTLTVRTLTTAAADRTFMRAGWAQVNQEVIMCPECFADAYGEDDE